MSELEHNSIYDILFPFTIINESQLKFDDKIEPYITWLYETLNQCRITQAGITEMQNTILQDVYSPTGQSAQAAGQRFNAATATWQ